MARRGEPSLREDGREHGRRESPRFAKRAGPATGERATLGRQLVPTNREKTSADVRCRGFEQPPPSLVRRLSYASHDRRSVMHQLARASALSSIIAAPVLRSVDDDRTSRPSTVAARASLRELDRRTTVEPHDTFRRTHDSPSSLGIAKSRCEGPSLVERRKDAQSKFRARDTSARELVAVSVLIGPRAIVRGHSRAVATDVIDIVELADVGVSSEQALYPIDHVFDGQSGAGGSCWVASRPGVQTIILTFRRALNVASLTLESEELAQTREQRLEIAIWSDGNDSHFQAEPRTVRFSPYGQSFHRTTWDVATRDVSRIRVQVTPQPATMFATLTTLSLR